MFWARLFIFCPLSQYDIISLQHAVILTLITRFLFIDLVFSGCETRRVSVRRCGRACARRGACRYCSSTEWFVSYNGGAGRTVLRQERQDRRALHIQTSEKTAAAARLHVPASLLNLAVWLTGCLAVAARKYWSQSTSESSSIDRAAGVRRAVYRLPRDHSSGKHKKINDWLITYCAHAGFLNAFILRTDEMEFDRTSNKLYNCLCNFSLNESDASLKVLWARWYNLCTWKNAIKGNKI